MVFSEDVDYLAQCFRNTKIGDTIFNAMVFVKRMFTDENFIDDNSKIFNNIFAGLEGGFSVIKLAVIYIDMLLFTVFFPTIGKGLFKIWDFSMDKLGRKRIIMDRANKEPYLIRYYLLFIERKNFPFNIFIHHILKDDDEDLHDHPWGFFSLILNGSYRETILNEKQYTETYWRGPGTFQRVTANHIHRISTVPPDGGCWTLFIPFKQQKQWGFWCYNKDYNKRVTRSAAAASSSENKVLSEWVWISSDEYLHQKIA